MSVTTFTTPGATTWTVPAATDTAIIECWGGGGNGAPSTGGVQGGGGGGGGEYSTVTISVTPTTVYDVTVGSAAGDSFVALSGTDQCRAKGGSNASTGTGGAGGTGGTGSTLHAGAAGANTSFPNGGGGGGAGSASANGTAGSGVTGGTFGGGAGGTDPAGGTNGTAPGGGGGGASRSSGTAGNGAAGQVQITFFAVKTTTITGGASITATVTKTQTGGAVVEVTNSVTLTGGAQIINDFAVMIGSSDVVNDDPSRIFEGRDNPLSFSLPKGQRGTASIDLILGPFDPFLPPIGTPVYIFLYGQREFAGTSQDIDIPQWIGESGYRHMVIPATDLEQVMDSIYIFPPRVYVNKPAGFIVRDLFDLCDGSPLSLGIVEDGPIIPIAVYSGDRLSDVYTQLATTAGFVKGVDPTTTRPSFYFRAQSTNAAPFTLRVGDVLWESSQYNQTRGDFRNRQLTRMSFQQQPPANVLFAGDSSTKIFTIPYLPAAIVKVNLTTSTQAMAVCTFTGVPAVGDYTVIGIGLTPSRYTFVDTLDNREPNQVLIGATGAQSAQNLADAINAEPSTIGTKFSLPTLENPVMNAGTATTSFTVTTKTPGSSKSLVEVTSSAAFSWGSVVDGTDGTDDPPLSADADYKWPNI